MFHHITSLQKDLNLPPLKQYVQRSYNGYIMLYLFHHITSLQKDLNLPPLKQYVQRSYNCYIMLYLFHHITSLQKDLNLPPPPNNTYKGPLMVIFYLIQNTSGAKGPLSARKARIRENRKFTSKNPSTTSWGSAENSSRFTQKKHRLRANVRICAR